MEKTIFLAVVFQVEDINLYSLLNLEDKVHHILPRRVLPQTSEQYILHILLRHTS